MKIKNKHIQSGFTLLELIVVMGIISILMAIAIPAESSYRLKAELKTSVKNLRSLYWDAQSLSLAPRSKDVTAYEIAITKQTASPTPPISEKECIDTVCTDIDQVNFGNNIYVSDIKCTSGSASGITTLATYFLVGDNKTSGTMVFYPTVSSSIPINCDKIEVIMSSSAVDNYQFNITLDKINNSINYSAYNP